MPSIHLLYLSKCRRTECSCWCLLLTIIHVCFHLSMFSFIIFIIIIIIMKTLLNFFYALTIENLTVKGNLQLAT